MKFHDHLTQLAVIGAGGKMGRGICLMLIKFLIKENLDVTPKLLMVDAHQSALDNLNEYLKAQLTKLLKKENDPWTDHLGKNLEEKQTKLETLMQEMFHFSTELESTKGKQLIFEAVPEIPELKINLLQQISKVADPNAIILSNTSSIPIHYLEEKAQLTNRLVGFHFYNPPPVQELLEVIFTKATSNDLRELSFDILKQLKKFPVESNDIAGFIGNGHFIRDGLHALNAVPLEFSHKQRCKELLKINLVSEYGCLRPMGIFQLIDYVGLDVFQCIASVMGEHLKQSKFESSLLQAYLKAKQLGGQDVQGGQRNGLFIYENRQIVGVYDPIENKTCSVDQTLMSSLCEGLGLNALPKQQWKDLKASSQLDHDLKQHFDSINQSTTPFSQLTQSMLANSHRIGLDLINDGVTKSSEDVNQVLIKGFHHLYGPINDYSTPSPAA